MFEKLESFLKTGSFPPPPAFCQSKEALSFYGFTDGTQPEEPGAALLYAADDCLVTCGVLSDRDLYNLKGSRFAIVRQNYTHGRKNPEITSTQVFPRTAHTPYLWHRFESRK